ncbi:MAG: hypothetical protein ABH851_01680 [Methanobacteriota archaeon]
MTKKKEKTKTDRILDGVETASTLVGTYLDQRYKIDKKVEDIKEQAEEKVAEVKKEAVHSAHEIKKGFIRAVLEIILLSTGVIALIIGVLSLLNKYYGFETILIGYGLLVTIIVLLQMKTD